MGYCMYGKASLVFPLSVSAHTALGVLAAAEDVPAIGADVIGYTTPLTSEAGACSVRLALQRSHGFQCAPGNYAVAVRAEGFDGWLPGLANTKQTDMDLLMEVVVLGRPDKQFGAVMYLPEDTLTALWPCSSRCAHVRLLQPMLLTQLSDCPGQWLRDRLLKLADMLEVRFRTGAFSTPAILSKKLQLAGLRLLDTLPDSVIVGPADRGARVDEQELGYWKEEMDHGHRCAGSMDGNDRLDIPDDIVASML